MAIITSQATILGIEPTQYTGRINLRPNEVTGSYRFSANSAGSIGWANWYSISTANNILCTFRYAPTGVSNTFCVVRSITASFLVTSYFSSGSTCIPLSVYVVRNWNTQGSQLATTYTSSTPNVNNKKRTSQAPFNASIAICTGANTEVGNTTPTAGIYGDSVTEDAVRYSQIYCGSDSSIGTAYLWTVPVDGPRDFINNTNKQNSDYVSHPLVLTSNSSVQEGFRIKNDLGGPIAGATKFVVGIEWDEYTSY